MSSVPASLVKELRDMTGAGMMDCKRALADTDGDLEAAQKLLREKGIAAAGKRASRETTEGIVLAQVEGSDGAIVAVGCETEPVSANEEFRALRAADPAGRRRRGPRRGREPRRGTGRVGREDR